MKELIHKQGPTRKILVYYQLSQYPNLISSQLLLFVSAQIPAFQTAEEEAAFAINIDSIRDQCRTPSISDYRTSMIVPRGRREVEIQEKHYPEDDARTTSARGKEMRHRER